MQMKEHWSHSSEKNPGERVLWAARWLEEASTSGQRCVSQSSDYNCIFLVKVQLYQYIYLHCQFCFLNRNNPGTSNMIR